MDIVIAFLDGMNPLFLKVLNMSITASYVILAVLLVRLCLRLLFPEVPKKYSYLLWLVVAFRLICPWSFDSQWSLFRWELFDMTQVQQVGSAELEYIPSDITTSKDAQVSVGIPAVNEALQGTGSGGVESVSPGSSEPPQYVAVGPELGRRILVQVGTVLWSIGMLGLAGYGLVSYLRLKRRMETAILLESNVFQSEQVRSPFILEFVHPRIYIPFGLKEEDLRYVLAHERTHLQRRDHLVKPLAYLLLAAHWFNPLVWIAFYGMSKDMELSCDEVVLSQGENIRKAYSETLLYLAVNHKHRIYSPLAFGETSVKTRIKNALQWKNPKLETTIGAGIVALLIIFLCAANPEKPTVEEEPFGKYYSSPDDLSGTTLYYRKNDGVGLSEIWYVTETGEMLIEHRSGLLDDPVEWLNAGRMEEFSLTTDNFDDYFYFSGISGYSLWSESDNNPFTTEGPGRYRRNNWKAWRVVAEDRMYYVLQQKDGEIYLAYGYYDSEGETDPFSDDSELFYFKRFAERMPAELERWGVILVEDYGMENVQPWDPIAEREQAALENDGSGQETEEREDGQTQPESQPEKESSSATGTSKYETLTLDIVRALAAKHDALTVEDLATYLDIRAVTERGSSLNKELVFEDGGVEYVLRVVASAEKNGNTYTHSLDHIILFTKEYQSAFSNEDQKRLHSGDIRSNNIDHIIQATVTIEDFFTVVLPEGIWQDRFQAGEYMGTRLLKGSEDGENTEQVGMIRVETIHYRWPTDTVKVYDSLVLDGAVMTRELVQFEEEGTYYMAVISKENSSVVYRIFLEEGSFSEGDFLTMTESIVMAPYAFY